MFSYYGGKSYLVSKYPKPKYRQIIEPFAGSARYALRYWAHDVLLIDVDPIVVAVWEWLQMADHRDIERLPIVTPGKTIPRVSSDAAWWFLRFCMNHGTATPRRIAGKFRCRRWDSITSQLFHIRHWKIQYGTYRAAPNVTATWFIDPPYQHYGSPYARHDLDYQALAVWCRSRKGQVIVCERSGADWLPFRALSGWSLGQRGTSLEAVWMQG